MEITVIANISANGKVLLAENPNHIAPEEAIRFFVQKATEIGNLVVGRKTFEVFKQFPGGPKQILPGVEIVVLSSTDKATDGYKVVSSPEEAIKYLEEQGFTDIAVGGGAKTYNSFFEKDLITDIYFDIIPLITGDGGIVGVDSNLFAKFKLLSHKLITNNIVQIHLSKELKLLNTDKI